MKKQILKACTIAALSLITSQTTYGQTWLQSSGNITSNPTSDKVGIGTTTPDDKLTVNGHMGYAANPLVRYLHGRSQDGLAIYSNNTWGDGSGIYMTTNSANGNVSFVANVGSGSAFSYWLADPNSSPAGAWTKRLFNIDKSGMFHFNGNIAYDNTNNSGPRYIQGNSDENVAIYSNGGFGNGAVLVISSNNSTMTPQGEVGVVSGGNKSSLSTQNPDKAFNVAQYNGGQFTPHFSIFKNGKVSIGDGSIDINTGTDYRLYVQTGIITERLKIALSTDQVNWSDYVFADNYQLRPLSEVEEYVKENKHLPEIPSAEDVYKDGLDVAQMDAKLLQKIEELTLYMIELKKENTTLRNEIDELKSKFNK